MVRLSEWECFAPVETFQVKSHHFSSENQVGGQETPKVYDCDLHSTFFFILLVLGGRVTDVDVASLSESPF